MKFHEIDKKWEQEKKSNKKMSKDMSHKKNKINMQEESKLNNSKLNKSKSCSEAQDKYLEYLAVIEDSEGSEISDTVSDFNSDNIDFNDEITENNENHDNIPSQQFNLSNNYQSENNNSNNDERIKQPNLSKPIFTSVVSTITENVENSQDESDLITSTVRAKSSTV